LNNRNLSRNLVKEFLYVTFYYEHRHDKLDIREYDDRINMIYEKYRPGRHDHLKGSVMLQFSSSSERRSCSKSSTPRTKNVRTALSLRRAELIE
jgi:hypothetical protein